MGTKIERNTEEAFLDWPVPSGVRPNDMYALAYWSLSPGTEGEGGRRDTEDSHPGTRLRAPGAPFYGMPESQRKATVKRLVEAGLLEEHEPGAYRATPAGKEAVGKHGRLIIVLSRPSSEGRFDRFAFVDKPEIQKVKGQHEKVSKIISFNKFKPDGYQRHSLFDSPSLSPHQKEFLIAFKERMLREGGDPSEVADMIRGSIWRNENPGFDRWLQKFKLDEKATALDSDAMEFITHRLPLPPEMEVFANKTHRQIVKEEDKEDAPAVFAREHPDEAEYVSHLTEIGFNRGIIHTTNLMLADGRQPTDRMVASIAKMREERPVDTVKKDVAYFDMIDTLYDPDKTRGYQMSEFDNEFLSSIKERLQWRSLTGKQATTLENLYERATHHKHG